MNQAHTALLPLRPNHAQADGVGTAQLTVLRQQLMRQARRVVHDPAIAEDLVQDTLLAVVRQHRSRRGDSSLRTWATAILKHKVADWYRSPTHRRLTQLNDDSDAPAGEIDALYDEEGRYVEPVPAWQQPDGQAERKEMMQALDSCMGCLPRLAHRVFMMREWLGFETAEICASLGVSADNCRMILHRARLALRRCMQRDWIGGDERS